MLLLLLDCHVEDVAEQIHRVSLKLHVERAVSLLAFQEPLGRLVSAPRIREEEQVVGVLFLL